MAPRRRASSSSQAAQPRESLSLAQHQALIYKRPVVIERVVCLRDFNELEYEGQSIQSNFEERGWAEFLGSTGGVYVDLVRDFYAQVLTVDANVEELTIQGSNCFELLGSRAKLLAVKSYTARGQELYCSRSRSQIARHIHPRHAVLGQPGSATARPVLPRINRLAPIILSPI
ncbi:hypothetical protein CJ030_MR5G006248 [Morella rubra]|uniref:Uncharacterized protein n=1 Tax=Morella rubra TaxID=262757 RepID=A0A6A1VIF7_9ROSI|nr:hypothetical protein CJ030_MR5G006248 [Morella rubra]